MWPSLTVSAKLVRTCAVLLGGCQRYDSAYEGPAKLTKEHQHRLPFGPMHIGEIRVPTAVAQQEVWGAAPVIAAAEKYRTASEP